MNTLSRILTICLCSAPMFDFAAHAVVASTSGHNLTAYNPSNSNNNQWASLTNMRSNSEQQVTARADFGNCNAVIMRCATPKCSNGGCVDSNIAAAIVAGCVQSNETCVQYGNELVSYMTAQLVANSTAKVNAQRAAADAAAAAQSANAEQTAAQIAQMQSSMQQQMMQMQQQMAAQNAQTQKQIQDALTAQKEQSNNTSQSVTTATQTLDTGVTPAQQDAIDRGVANEILARQKITGQIITQIEDAEVSLKAVRTAMQNSFEYAGCDSRGNNCTGPKRIKKWRELATDFLDPYDNTIDKIYDALITAQTVGVPLDDIYMMLNDSCNAWGQYMCPPGKVVYSSTDKGEKGAPMVCPDSFSYDGYIAAAQACQGLKDGTNNEIYLKCIELARRNYSYSSTEGCQHCTLLKVLTDKADIYDGWIYTDDASTSNQTIVACASNVLDSSKLFTRRTRSKNGAGLVDIDQLDVWLHQTEPNISTNGVTERMKYCFANNRENDIKILQSSASSRTVPAKDAQFCVTALVAGTLNENLEKNDACPYIAGTYAICDTHPYNAGITQIDKSGSYSASATATPDVSQIEQIREIIGLKITVISQQMYKQYEYLNATLRRLKTQLQKSILTTNLEAAGAKSEDSSSSSGLLGSNKNSQYRDCSGKSKQGLLECLRENYSILSTQIKTNKKCDRYAKDQLSKAVAKLKSLTKTDLTCETNDLKGCGDCLENYDTGMAALDSIILEEESQRRGYGR